jgi:hypothetical protein
MQIGDVGGVRGPAGNATLRWYALAVSWSPHDRRPNYSSMKPERRSNEAPDARKDTFGYMRESSAASRHHPPRVSWPTRVHHRGSAPSRHPFQSRRHTDSIGPALIAPGIRRLGSDQEFHACPERPHAAHLIDEGDVRLPDTTTVHGPVSWSSMPPGRMSPGAGNLWISLTSRRSTTPVPPRHCLWATRPPHRLEWGDRPRESVPSPANASPTYRLPQPSDDHFCHGSLLQPHTITRPFDLSRHFQFCLYGSQIVR